MAFNSGGTYVGHQACALQVMCGVHTHSAADVTKELDIQWIVNSIVQDQLDYREFCARRIPKNPADGGKCHFMGLSCIHCTCCADQKEQFWSWNIVKYSKYDTRKSMLIEILSSPSNKENGNIVISKEAKDSCLWTINVRLFWTSLSMVRLLIVLWYT
jgi:hypothetical protein